MSDSKPSVSFNFDSLTFWLFLFLFFWGQSGWYRIDCAIGIKAACDLIAAEKDYRKMEKAP